MPCPFSTPIRISLFATLIFLTLSGPARSANLIGDADNDGSVTPTDAALVQGTLYGFQPASSISAAGDGQHVVTGSEDTTIRLWDVNTAQQLKVMRLHVAPVRSVQFVPGTAWA